RRVLFRSRLGRRVQSRPGEPVRGLSRRRGDRVPAARRALQRPDRRTLRAAGDAPDQDLPRGTARRPGGARRSGGARRLVSARRIVIVGGGVAGYGAAMAARETDPDAQLWLLCAEDALPYDRTTLSKQVLTEGISPQERLLAPAEAFRTARVDVRTGARVAALESAARTVVTEDGTRYAYDALVLATGARPRTLSAVDP